LAAEVAVHGQTRRHNSNCSSSRKQRRPTCFRQAEQVQAIAIAASHTTITVASANCKFKTPSGTYNLTVIPTVTAAGSSKSWQMNAISLTLVVVY
jgi:hypothetical protein